MIHPPSTAQATRLRGQQREPRQNGRRRGSVIVIASLSLTVLLGFCALAADYGMLVSDANRLQRACDASALAGASQLKKTGNDVVDVALAKQAAIDMMRQYKVAGFDPNAISFNATWNRITVPASVTRNYFFGGIFKLISPNSASNSLVARQAIGARTALKGVPAVSPLAITVEDYESFKAGTTSFENILIDNNRQDFSPTILTNTGTVATRGTVTAVDLRLDSSGKSGPVFQNDVANGTPGTTVIGQPVQSTLNADLSSQGAKLELAIKDRFARAKNAPWYDNGNTYTFPNYPADDPRIITIMVADKHPADNNNPVLIARYFVSVYVEAIRTPGKDTTYLQIRILPSNTFSSDRSDIIAGDENTPFSGPSVIGLVG